MPEPKVRFKMDDGSSFPAWNDVVLGDIATRVTRKNTNGETDRPLTIASIEGLVDQRTYFGKTIASKDMTGYFLLKNGEYAYNKSYSAGYDYGSIKRLDKYDMGALSTLYICFALDEDQNTDFYDCYFNGLSWYNQMPQICAEGARNHGLLNVSPNDFFKIQLSVPSSKEEQQKIADFLSSVDEVITASEEEVANLETQKKAVMKKIFSQEVRFKRADGSDFPEWEKVRFWDAVSLNSSLVDPKEEPYCHMLHVGAANIEKSTGILLPCMTASEEGITSGKYLFDETCVVYSKIRPELSKATVPGFTGLCSADAYPLKPRADILPRIILMQILSDKFVKFATSTSARTKMPKINQEELGEYVFAIPCFEEQCLIADFLSDFDEAIAAAKKELELWKELKKGLLQQMFV